MAQLLLQPKDEEGLRVCSAAATAPPDRSCEAVRSLKATGLEEALSTLADEVVVSSFTGFRMFVAGRPKVLNSDIQDQIYLITREALLNAVRHAEATSVETEIEYSPSKFRVIVRDNGCGINPHEVAESSHCGLRDMHERADKIGGELRVWSRRGAGTEVEVCVPSHTLRAFRSVPLRYGRVA